MNNNEVKPEKYYLKLLEKQKEFTEKDKQCINRLLKENEELKDLVKRQVCQAECYRYKQYEQLTQKLEKAREYLNAIVKGTHFTEDLSGHLIELAQQALKELE